MSDTSIPQEDQEWCSEHFQYNCTDLSHGVSEPPPITSIFLGSVDDAPFGDVEMTKPDGTDDLPPDFLISDADEEIKVGDGSCVVCGTPTFRPPGLTKAGHKKRAPKYCDTHNPKLRVPEKGPFTSGLEGEQQLKRIQEELADDIKLLGVMFGPLLPVTGVYVFSNADSFTIALLKLCKNNPRALRVLHRAASVAPVYEVAKDVAGVAYSMQVDMQKQDPHNTIARRLGVEDAYQQVYPDSTQGNGNSVPTNGVTGPPRYAPV